MCSNDLNDGTYYEARNEKDMPFARSADRKEMIRAAQEYRTRTGKFANVVIFDGEHDGEVEWQG